MSESYGHRITAIHANPNNKCDHCKQPALWETDYKFFGENVPRGSNPEQVCDTHAKQFAAKWPDAKFLKVQSRIRRTRVGFTAAVAAML